MAWMDDAKAGDKVRLTHENGDNLTFTVTSSSPGYIEGAYGNGFLIEEEWDVEILERKEEALPTAEFSMVTKLGHNPYIIRGGRWVEVGYDRVYHADRGLIQRAIRDYGYKVVFDAGQETGETND